jgi:hypothetical protein
MRDKKNSVHDCFALISPFRPQIDSPWGRGFECNGVWLLKNSLARNPQKFHRARIREGRDCVTFHNSRLVGRQEVIQPVNCLAIVLTGDKSPFHSSTPKKTKEKRTLVKWPGCDKVKQRIWAIWTLSPKEFL